MELLAYLNQRTEYLEQAPGESDSLESMNNINQMLQAKAWCNPQSIVNYPKVSELGGVVQTIYMNDGYQLLFERSCRGQQKLENHQLIHQKIEERKK